MTKKELEIKVADLEKQINELRGQLLTLSLQRNVTFVPMPAPLIPQPIYPPPVIISEPYKIGDFPLPNIMCKADMNIQ